MNNESVYWLWLAKTLGAGAKTADIINYFGSARMLYDCLLYTSDAADE